MQNVAGQTPEPLRGWLHQQARERWGEARAAAIAPALERLASALESVAQRSVADETAPDRAAERTHG